MKKFLPYGITHINLDKDLKKPDLETQNQGNYLVFWWKHIPLGHLFIEPKENFDSAFYYGKLVEVLGPTLAQYHKNHQSEDNYWQSLLLDGDFDKWTIWMEEVFASITARPRPNRVPVSLVICTRNRVDDLKKCLDSISSLTVLPEEVIIVDNARTNDRTEKLVATYKGIKYYEEPVPGLSYARNTGVRRASQEIIAFTDDDVLLHHLWIQQVWEAFSQSHVAAMTGLVLAAELRTETQFIFEKHWSFNQGFIDKFYNPTYFRKTLPIGPPVWEIGAGANMAFRRSIFAKLGYFDERLGAGASGCSEDSEMWYRILLNEQTIHYNPRAIVFHKHRDEKAALHKQLFAYMRGFAAAALIQQKQHPKAGYKRHLFITLPKYYLFLLFRGFPKYAFRFQTIRSEITGLLSGLLFYLKHQKIPRKSK
jgi:GT2 family glycosyltransferase